MIKKGDIVYINTDKTSGAHRFGVVVEVNSPKDYTYNYRVRVICSDSMINNYAEYELIKQVRANKGKPKVGQQVITNDRLPYKSMQYKTANIIDSQPYKNTVNGYIGESYTVVFEDTGNRYVLHDYECNVVRKTNAIPPVAKIHTPDHQPYDKVIVKWPGHNYNNKTGMVTAVSDLSDGDWYHILVDNGGGRKIAAPAKYVFKHAKPTTIVPQPKENDMRVPFTVSNDSITVFINGDMRVIPSSDGAYAELREHLKSDTHDLDVIEQLIDKPKRISRLTAGLVKVEGSTVTYAGQAIHSALTAKLIDLLDDGFDATPWAMFMSPCSISLNTSRLRSLRMVSSWHSSECVATTMICIPTRSTTHRVRWLR